MKKQNTPLQIALRRAASATQPARPGLTANRETLPPTPALGPTVTGFLADCNLAVTARDGNCLTLAVTGESLFDKLTTRPLRQAQGRQTVRSGPTWPTQSRRRPFGRSDSVTAGNWQRRRPGASGPGSLESYRQKIACRLIAIYRQWPNPLPPIVTANAYSAQTLNLRQNCRRLAKPPSKPKTTRAKR